MKDILKSLLKVLNLGDLIGKLFDMIEAGLLKLLGKAEEEVKKKIDEIEKEDEVVVEEDKKVE